VITYILLYGAYLTYFSLLLGGRFQASPITIGLFISVLGLVTASSAFQVGRLSRRFSVVSLLTVAFVIYAVAMAIILVVPNLWLCLLPTVLFGLAHGLNLPSQRVIAAGVAPLEYRAGFMAINGTMIPLGMTLGPMLMGLVFSLTSLNITFLVAALLALIIPVMAVVIGKGKLFTA
jgi:ACDE family multidrug resistance protein